MAAKRNAGKTPRQPVGANTAFAETASRLSDIAVASGKVVTHRVGMAFEAMNDPNFIEHAEFTTMATEKMDAMVDVAHGIFDSIWSIGTAFTSLAIGQGSGLAHAAFKMGTAKTPYAAFAAHQRWAADSFALANAHTMRMTELISDAASSAVEPVHSRVVANALRLDKR